MNSDCKYETVAIIMLDLDHFKKVNDTYGHGAGDLVLSSVGKVLMGKEADNIRAARLVEIRVGNKQARAKLSEMSQCM